ncbi:hypothetical protein F66182_18747, partial [Fusarium sp. NRRL 66182]
EKRSFPATESPSPNKKKGSSSRREGGMSVSVTTHALPATPSKKVRRINMSTSGTSTDEAAQAISKPMPVGTPIPKRKKLTPRLKSTPASSVEFSSDHPTRDMLSVENELHPKKQDSHQTFGAINIHDHIYGRCNAYGETDASTEGRLSSLKSSDFVVPGMAWHQQVVVKVMAL